MRVRAIAQYTMLNGKISEIEKTYEFETRPAQGQWVDVSDDCTFVVNKVKKDRNGEPVSLIAIVDFEMLQSLRRHGWKESALR
jgi:hypothetical protein